MPYEVACVDISPLEDGDKAEFCVVGLWTEISVSILRLPSLEQVDNQPLGGGMHMEGWEKGGGGGGETEGGREGGEG